MNASSYFREGSFRAEEATCGRNVNEGALSSMRRTNLIDQSRAQQKLGGSWSGSLQSGACSGRCNPKLTCLISPDFCCLICPLWSWSVLAFLILRMVQVLFFMSTFWHGCGVDVVCFFTSKMWCGNLLMFLSSALAFMEQSSWASEEFTHYMKMIFFELSGYCIFPYFLVYRVNYFFGNCSLQCRPL